MSRPRPPSTPGEIHLPFRSSILFLHSCYPPSLSTFPHSYALIKFNNFCATRALCVLFALFPPPPFVFSLSLLGIFRILGLFLPLGIFAACLCDSPRSLSRYKLVWRLARALPPSCYYYRVPQIYDGDMLDPVKQARSARDFISEREERGGGLFRESSSSLLRMLPFLLLFFPPPLYPFSVIFAITSEPSSRFRRQIPSFPRYKSRLLVSARVATGGEHRKRSFAPPNS